jgi:hypothetical protein
MGGMFKKPKMPDNSKALASQEAYQQQQIELQKKQMALQEKQQERVDSSNNDLKRQAMARMRAAQGGGVRALMSEESLNPTNGKSTLGA